MHKSSRHIWKQVFRNLCPITVPLKTAIHLLPCSQDLTEPQYANLAFSQHCHYKGHVFRPDPSEGVPRGLPWLRVRYCDKGESANTIRFCKEKPAHLECDPAADIQKSIAIRPPTYRSAFLLDDFFVVESVYARMDIEERRRYQIDVNRRLIERRIVSCLSSYCTG